MTLDFSLVLTAGGAAASAVFLAGVIELAKRLPGIGPILDAGKEAWASVVGAAILVGYAAWATGYVVDPVSIGGLFLAWYGIARLASASYDTAKALTA